MLSCMIGNGIFKKSAKSTNYVGKVGRGRERNRRSTIVTVQVESSARNITFVSGHCAYRLPLTADPCAGSYTTMTGLPNIK